MEAQGPIAPTSSSALYNPKGYPRLLQTSLANSGLLLLTLTEGSTGVGSFVFIPIEAQGRHQAV